MRWVVVMLGLLLPCAAAAQTDFDALLEDLRAAARDSATLNREREQRFLQQKNQRQALQREADAELAESKRRADAAAQRYEAQQAELKQLRQTLDDSIGELAQVYAQLRTAAGELREQERHAIGAAELPQGDVLLGAIADSRSLPRLAQIEAFQLWLLQRLRADGEVVRFEHEVVQADGRRVPATVVRVGAFSAFSDDGYLIRGDAGGLLALPKPPSWRLRRLIPAFQATSAGEPAPILIDPTHGDLLAIEAEKPDLRERVMQGGVVGYVILLLGALGLLLALWQINGLSRVARKVRRQLRELGRPDPRNPLGRVLSAIGGELAQEQDPELLELRLSEAVVRETPRLERFQGLLRLFVAVAPLLGLLGTVTGMILTFQAITVFGTNDPKLMAGGISQALITTVLGLVVAIPLLFANSLLATRSRALVQVLDEQSALALARRLEGGRA